MKYLRTSRVFVVALFILCVQTGFAQNGKLSITYTVSLNDPASQQFHVSTSIKNINQPRLDLSLPTWTPGWYTVENYFKNVLRFRITDGKGNILPHTMSKKQTWNVDTKGLKEIKVDYDYRATILALNQAKISKDFAFFTGIELFLEPVGYRNAPSTVHFQIPGGWKLVTALKETSDPMTFTAANYDALVDAPVEMGNFDVTKFEVEGKPHYFVANPAGAFSAEKTARFVEMLTKVAQAGSKLYGGLPYEKYVYFYFFASPESNASGALEHLNSFVAFAPPGDRATPEMIIGTAAHEFFHLWNVKRARPAEMWPYDYSRENETPLLWVSEGFTNYYGNVLEYRAGLDTEEGFLRSAANAAAGVENNEVRNYVSPAEASVSTWVGYDTPVAFGISYYGQGQNLAALLDLSIRNDTDGRYSLDDVMRALFNNYYKKDRGFTTGDMLAEIKKLTNKDHSDFYRRYVFGTDVPDYDEIFGYAGYRVEKKEQQSPDFGFFGRFRNNGYTLTGVIPNSAAADAGLRTGDVITKIDGASVVGYPLGSAAGKTLTLTVSHGGVENDVKLTVGTRTFTAYSLVDLSAKSAKQIRIREGWLKR